MADEGIDITDSKPNVLIYATLPVSETIVDYILWGLEEEGIPFEREEKQRASIESLAKKAANLSKLNVGIAVNCEAQSAVLHHRDLPPDKPLFALRARDFNPSNLRRLGANAARLAKGNRLIFENEMPDFYSPDKGVAEKTSDTHGRDEMKDLISQIIKELQIKENSKENS